MRPEYKPNPTKDDLRDYFAPRVAVRKMTCIEAMRLMDVDDSDIYKIMGYPFNNPQERKNWIKSQKLCIEGLIMELRQYKPRTEEYRHIKNRLHLKKADLKYIKDQGIAKTSIFKLAGNSIVVSCLYHLFRTLFIPGQPENEIQPLTAPKQLSLFDL
ncbi:MAG: hypothetical protein NC311_07530 [Muribaculaceae bacterium]|nr:hypothetical protein [Muribaculaceae bacterium]